MNWTLPRRVRFCALVAAACGWVMAALVLVFADIPGGRSFNKYSSTGSNDLWPEVAWLLLVPPLVGAVIGLLLPWYRRRFGSVVVGLGALVVIGVLSFAFGAAVHVLSGGRLALGVPPGTVAEWVERLLLLGFTVAAAILLAGMGRPLALGQGDTSPRGDQ